MTHRLLSKPVAGAVATSAGDATELKEELDEDLVHCVISFQLISSGASRGDRGSVALGVVFFYLVLLSDLVCIC